MALSQRQQWKDAVRASKLDPYAKLICLIYAEYCKRDDPMAERVWINHATLCDETGLATNTVTKWRTTLIDLGWLTLTMPHKGRRSARYALTIPDSCVATPATQKPADPRGSDRLNDLTPGDTLSRKSGIVESQIRAVRVATPATESLESLESLDQNRGFRGPSPAHALAENPADEWLDDDPWIRQQESEPDQPPPHVAAQFRALTLVTNPVEPDITVCEHGVILGLTLGNGEPACCPTPADTEDP